MPAATRLVAAPRIKINGSDAPATDDAAIVDLHVSNAVGVPSQLTIRFADPDFDLLDGGRYAIGAELDIGFPDAKDAIVRVFLGEIVSVGTDQHADRFDGCELTVTALDISHRLGHNTQVRTFQNMKYSDVVSKIAAETSLRAQVEDTRIKFDYLIQTTTNYAFLDEIAFRTGYEWRVEDSTLIFKPRSATAPRTVTYGEDIRRIRARFTAASETADVTVRSWDPLTKRVVVGNQAIAASRRAGTTGGTNGLVDTGRSKAKQAWKSKLGTSSLIATSSDEATEIARALSGRVATADLDVRCECVGTPDIKPGSTVEIKNAGTKLSGTYYVTSVDHRFGRTGDLTTTFATGAPDSSSIVELLGSGNERVGPFGKLGLTIGIVTNNKDPDGVGRVRVKFPALSDSEESWWARVVTPGAGSEAGLMFMPQIDDEVLVGFEHGDLRRPFVLGGVWGAKAKPPAAAETFLAQNKVVHWGLRTHNGSTLAIRSGTQPQDKHYKVSLPDGTTQYMGSDKTEIIAMNKSIELKSGEGSILITDKGDIHLKGMNIKIEATQGITIDGVNISSKAKASYKAEGTSALELKANGPASLESSSITQIKGSLVKIQ